MEHARDREASANGIFRSAFGTRIQDRVLAYYLAHGLPCIQVCNQLQTHDYPRTAIPLSVVNPAVNTISNLQPQSKLDYPSLNQCRGSLDDKTFRIFVLNYLLCPQPTSVVSVQKKVPISSNICDGDRRLPKEDCPKCRSRRIKCDRTLPECRKCSSRGIQCPGYGLILRWGQGVASRGKLTGQQLPVQQSRTLTLNDPKCIPVSPNESNHVNIPSQLGHFGPHVHPRALELVHHYQQNVAGKLAWVDGPRNPWRQVMIPLAWACPTVFHTILSLSSEDLALRYGDDDQRRLELQCLSLRFRNNALTMVASHISSIREKSALVSGNQYLNEARFALASTLILYNVELLGAEGMKWRMHLKGARVIHQWLEQFLSQVTSFDEIDKFLLYEHYYSSVFADLTIFDTANEPPKDSLQNMGDLAVFGDFVRVIQLVTKLERFKYDHNTPINTSQVQDILQAIEMAKDSMISFGQHFYFWSDRAQQDFQHLVLIFYHASQVYTHRAISNDMLADSYIQAFKDSILAHFDLLSDKTNFAHDLVWPLFILGTESRGDTKTQSMVSMEMESVMKISGVLDRRNVLSFLQHYWAVDLADNVTWIQFMRDFIPGNSMLIL